MRETGKQDWEEIEPQGGKAEAKLSETPTTVLSTDSRERGYSDVHKTTK